MILRPVTPIGNDAVFGKDTFTLNPRSINPLGNDALGNDALGNDALGNDAFDNDVLDKGALEDESPTVWYSRNVLELMEQFQNRKSSIESELDEALKVAGSDKTKVIGAGKLYAKRMSELQLAYTDKTQQLIESWKERMEATEELN